MKRLFAAALSLALAGGISVAQETERKPAKREARGDAAKVLLEKYDTNKNGVLDADEKEAAKKDRKSASKANLKKFDKNSDGKLDESERATMREDAKNPRPKKNAERDRKKDEVKKKTDPE